MTKRTDSLESPLRNHGLSLSPLIASKINKYARNIGHHPAFLSNSKRILANDMTQDYTPGPGNYAQYSSIHSPLIFPRGDDDSTYIMYENGRMLRRFQNYAVSKADNRNHIQLNNSPGPGSYDINVSSFRKLKKRINREKGKLIVWNLTSPSIPSNNIYDDSSSEDDDIINSLNMQYNRQKEIMDRVKKRINNKSFDEGRFNTLNNHRQYNNSFSIDTCIDNSLTSKGRIIKVINKGPK